MFLITGDRKRKDDSKRQLIQIWKVHRNKFQQKQSDHWSQHENLLA